MSFDDITVARLREIGGMKWAGFEGKLGAFVAEMDFGLAQPIREVLHRVVDDGISGYIAPPWTQRLQEATASFVERRYGWQVAPDHILGSPDVLTGLTITMRHHIAPDARVIVPTPAYMPFMIMPEANGHELVQLPLRRTDSSWELDLEALDDVFRQGDLLVLCNPHNPIGKVYSREELVAISEIVDKYNGRVFNDEIHAPLTLDGALHVPYPTVNEQAARHSITSMSASKAWNLAGFKCAQLILNDDDLAGADAFSFDLHGTATPGLFANVAAFEAGEPWLDEVIAYLEENQRTMHELLAEELPGVRCIPNEGTYLAWLDCAELELPGKPQEFFQENAGVALTDGGMCGDVGVHSVRLNFATPRPVLVEMIQAMGRAVRQR